MRLFLYGSLAAPHALACHAGRPLTTAPVPAWLAGFTRVRLRGSRYPTLRRAPGAAVYGIVATVTAEMMRRLSAYETPRYRRIAVRVATPCGLVPARCFLGDAPTRAAWTPPPRHNAIFRPKYRTS